MVWILDNVPRFEQAKFKELGLHDAVIQLFDSSCTPAQKYAANYARTNARDLPVPQLIQLINNSHQDVRRLAIDLIQSRDPRTEIGLEAWGQLLATGRGKKLAEESLRKHFGANALTAERFATLLVADEQNAREFAQSRLIQLHPLKKLGVSYFVDVIEQADVSEWYHQGSVNFCCEQLEKIGPAEISTEHLQRLFLAD